MPHRSMPYLLKPQAMSVGHLSLLQKIVKFAGILAGTETPLSVPPQNPHPKLYLLHPKPETETKEKEYLRLSKVHEKLNWENLKGLTSPLPSPVGKGCTYILTNPNLYFF